MGFRPFLALIALCAGVAEAQTWSRLKDDGLHDPRSPAIKEKQEAADALGELARKGVADPGVGNQVLWARALEKGLIVPRSQIWQDTKVRVLDLDIYLNIGGSLPVVRFPHSVHTPWLDCSNCHEAIFSTVAGNSPISMQQILEGEQCGVCHGAVAFPLTECVRCHSIPQTEYPAIEARLGLQRVGPKRQVGRKP